MHNWKKCIVKQWKHVITENQINIFMSVRDDTNMTKRRRRRDDGGRGWSSKGQTMATQCTKRNVGEWQGRWSVSMMEKWVSALRLLFSFYFLIKKFILFEQKHLSHWFNLMPHVTQLKREMPIPISYGNGEDPNATMMMMCLGCLPQQMIIKWDFHTG
jgi:hypothetical protein